MIIAEENYLAHYGILRKSGRYPWGSGEDSEQRSRDFLKMVDDLKKQGLSDSDIMTGFGMNTTDFRAAKSIARNQTKQADILMAQRLHDKGYSNGAIAERMFGSKTQESTVRSLLAPGQKDKTDVLQSTAAVLRDAVEKKNYIDVGVGIENHLGVSNTRLNTAVAMLKEEGYKLHYLKVPQLGTGKETTLKVLSKPDVPWKEVLENRENIEGPTSYSEDGGRTFTSIKYPEVLKSSRLAVRYAEDGGTDADGVMYIRPGVKDLDMGASHYAQVRINVDNSHYLKGMAIYKDDLPAGVDVMFNTNKSNTGEKLDALKPLKTNKDGEIDKEMPFGAAISRQHGVLNIVNEEGNWDSWSRTLSSQFLSKQSPSLVKSQLEMAYEQRKNQLDEIKKLTNPEVRKKLLDSFADDADSASIHLKAAQLPGQASHVILPLDPKKIKETEIYAPNYRNGDRVVLIRHPHGGTFEIPELTVNNRNPEGRKILGVGEKAAKDAVGIHPKVAERLSGADFDGDTVLVIPNNSGRVKTSPPLESLKSFDPKMYKLPDDSPIKRMTSSGTQRQMGDISNLITDMTIKGASQDELARAVRHSMVVIDAEKHGLNYRQSAIDNGIASLKAKYQLKDNGKPGGASTLISRKKQDVLVPERKQSYRIDPATGKKIFTETGASFVGRDGRTVVKTSKVKLLSTIDDANELSSGTPKEKLYADYSNRVRDLANEARKEMVRTSGIPYSPSAREAYSEEVRSLDAKLNIALRNAPLERKAQLVANALVSAKKQDYPDMTSSDLKKVKAQALTTARNRVGAKKIRVDITDREWEAIQHGAVSSTKLKKILDNSNLDEIKKLATPKTNLLMTSSKVDRAKGMIASGYTQAEVAAHLGVSLSTLKKSLSGEET